MSAIMVKYLREVTEWLKKIADLEASAPSRYNKTLTFSGGASGTYDGSKDVMIQIPQNKTLTFSGGASGTYDGSKDVMIQIPEKAEEVVYTATTEEATDAIVIDKDKDGLPFALKKWSLSVFCTGALSAQYLCNLIAGSEVQWSATSTESAPLYLSFDLSPSQKGIPTNFVADCATVLRGRGFLTYDGDSDTGIGRIDTTGRTATTDSATGHTSRMLNVGTPLTQVRLTGYSTTAEIPQGTKITLKGIRA